MSRKRALQARVTRARSWRRGSNGAGQRAEALLDQRRRFAHENQRAPSLLENAQVPLQSLAELFRLHRVRRRLVLMFAQILSREAEFFRHFLLLEAVAIKSGDDLAPLRIEPLEHAGEQYGETVPPLVAGGLGEIPR